MRDLIAKTSDTFLIDANVFPGNSGGPVVLTPEVTAIAGTKSHAAAKLIGVVQEYLPFVDVAVSQQTGRIRATFEENSGLSPVIPIDRVEETIDELLAQGNDESLPSDT